MGWDGKGKDRKGERKIKDLTLLFQRFSFKGQVDQILRSKNRGDNVIHQIVQDFAWRCRKHRLALTAIDVIEYAANEVKFVKVDSPIRQSILVKIINSKEI